MKQAWPAEGIFLTPKLLMESLCATSVEPAGLIANLSVCLSVLTSRILLGVQTSSLTRLITTS